MTKLPAPPGRIWPLEGVDWHVVERPANPGGEDKPTLVLIHGKGGSVYDFILSEAWALIEQEPGRPRLLVVDRPASGHTASDPRVRIGPVEQAERLWRLLDHLDVGKALLAGHSVGGTIALLMMQHSPERVPKALLIAPVTQPDRLFALLAKDMFSVPGWRGDFVGWSSRWVSRIFRKAFRRQPFAPNLDAVPEGYFVRSELALSKAHFRADMRNMAPMQEILKALQDAYPAWPVPVGILTGEEDRLIDPAHSRNLAQALPQARLTMLPGIGHMLPLAAPDVLLEALRRLWV